MRYSKKKKTKSINTKSSNTIILVDDREKQPWHIPGPFTLKKARLKVGDYSIKGFEDKVAIEKKSGIIELISNLSGRDRPRFKRFLEKLSAYPIKCIIIEDALSHIESAFRACPKSQLAPTSIYYWLSVINIKYQIPTLFIGKNKQHRDQILYHIFSEIVKELDNF